MQRELGLRRERVCVRGVHVAVPVRGILRGLAENAACIAGDAPFDGLCSPASDAICVPTCAVDVDCPQGTGCHDGVCTPLWTEREVEPGDDVDTDSGSPDGTAADADVVSDALDDAPDTAAPDTGADTIDDVPEDTAIEAPDDTAIDATTDVDTDTAGASCPGGGEWICGTRIGGAADTIFRCEDGAYVDETACALDCVYVAGGDDVCVDECPAELRAPFCGTDGLPEDSLFTCNATRVLSFGRCENGCGALTGPGPNEGCP